MPSAEPARPVRRRLAWILAVLLALLAALAAAHRPLLRVFARAWIVGPAPEAAPRADAVVVSAGARPEVFQQAVELWRTGAAPQIIVTRCETRPTDRAGITTPFVEQRRRWLDEADVPASAREFIGEEIRLLSQELTVVRSWAATNQVRRLLFPTEPFPTRRVAWLARRQLAPLGIEPVTIPVPGPH
ncbi:MAG: hypothetical protein FJ148_28980, partial [Deltaproteobacteria bacterium]|nr:hypothetical protein [Deltaproteobacteria bacterium]